MPTIITHSLIGFLSGKLSAFEVDKKRFWFFSIVLPMLPDADVLTFYFNIHYSHFIGHRGFFHSIFFAYLIGIIIVTFFFRKNNLFSRKSLLLMAYFGTLTASHGIFDAMTNGGMGIALLAPFDNTRYFLPFRPIQVSPIGITKFFSYWGYKTLFSEMLYIWTPAVLITFLTLFIKKKRKNPKKI